MSLNSDQLLRLKTLAEDIVEILDGPEVNLDHRAASREAADYAVKYHMANGRWPTWDECFEAGRAVGREEKIGEVQDAVEGRR